MIYVYIAVGGAAGALSRYLLSGWVQNRCSGDMPWGTLAANVLGCILMGVLAKALFDSSIMRPEFRTALLVGGLGALTTFSSFSFEALSLVNDGQFRTAAGYILMTNAFCLASVWIGYRLAERLLA